MRMNAVFNAALAAVFVLLAGTGTGWALQCSATATPLVFDPASAGALSQSGLGALEMSCSDFSGSANVKFCVKIGGGSSGSSGSGDLRRLIPDAATPTYSLTVNGVPVSVDGDNTIGVFSIDSEIPGPHFDIGGTINWTAAGPAGQYTSTFAAADFEVSYGTDNNCTGGSTTVSGFSVTGNLDAGCKIDASSLDFGSIPANITSAISAATALSVNCTGVTPYTVTLGYGQHYDDVQNQRSMSNGTKSLRYQLLSEPGVLWTEVAGTGNGETQMIPIYGMIPSGQSGLDAGIYTDTVVVTVNY